MTLTDRPYTRFEHAFVDAIDKGFLIGQDDVYRTPIDSGFYAWRIATGEILVLRWVGTLGLYEWRKPEGA